MGKGGRLTIRSADFGKDPYSYYKSLRRQGGIHFLPDENVWLVVKYDLASSILRQPAVFSSSPFAVLSPSFHGADAPDHTVMRRFLNPFFTPERQQAQRESIARHIARIIARIETVKTFDAVADLAIPIPFSVACSWLGLREDIAAEIHRHPASGIEWADVVPALLSDGIIPELVAEGSLPKKQIAELASFFIAASYGSSRDLLLLGLSVLMENPEVVARVNADMSLMPVLVEEILRLEPSAHTLLRRTRSEVEIGGQKIPEGSMIWVSLGAANRDPEVFDDPDELKLDRVSTRHLAFGIGPHFCIGSPMARLENEMILTRLMPLIPRLRPTGPMDIGFWDDFPGNVPSSRQIRSWPMVLAR